MIKCSLSRGHVKESNLKECVLIIDEETGEITLERLSGNILVKKTRQEKIGDSLSAATLGIGGRTNGAPLISRPSTPLEPMRRDSPGRWSNRWILDFGRRIYGLMK